LICCAGMVTTFAPVLGLTLLAAALVPGATFLAWAPWLERLYRSEGVTRTANVVGRHEAEFPRTTLILMAHHDSKSQSIRLPFRVGLTIVALFGVLALAGIGTALFFGLSVPPWAAPAVAGLTAAAALALSTIKNGNESPGGVDNAGSVGIIEDVARRLIPALPGDVELLVLSTGAEEDHMIGALRWLDAHAEQLPRPTFCLNLDGAGAPGREVLITRYGFGRCFAPAISAAARRAAARLGLRPRAILMLPGLGIDAIPFAHRGIPCLTFASGSLGRATLSVHSKHDTVENLDPVTLGRIADLVYETSMELCGAVNEPARERPAGAE
ncbi:MAG: M28 family peptidase, partial [Acidobacteriota bacterium]